MERRHRRHESGNRPATRRRDDKERLGLAGFVTDTTHRHHDLRVLGIVLDLGALALHVHIDQSGIGRVAIAPHLLEQDFASEDLMRLAR